MKTRTTNDGRLVFWCPGCDEAHGVAVNGARLSNGAGWTWNGDRDNPTLSPSVLIRSGHFLPNNGDSCWCTYNAEHPNDPAPFKCECCHSFVTNGMIQFLGDCNHALAGQAVPIPDWPLGGEG